MIDNLVINDVNHTYSERRQIRVALESLPSVLQVTIADHGAGIAPENLERIFEQFFSIPSDYSTRTVGHFFVNDPY